MAKKKMLTVEIEPLDLYTVFECPIDQIIDYFKCTKEDYEVKGFEDISVMVKDDVECWESKGLVLVGKRLETDKEFEKRLKEENRFLEKRKKQQEDNVESERKQLKRLIRKHGIPENLDE